MANILFEHVKIWKKQKNSIFYPPHPPKKAAFLWFNFIVLQFNWIFCFCSFVKVSLLSASINLSCSFFKCCFFSLDLLWTYSHISSDKECLFFSGSPFSLTQYIIITRIFSDLAKNLAVFLHFFDYLFMRCKFLLNALNSNIFTCAYYLEV